MGQNVPKNDKNCKNLKWPPKKIHKKITKQKFKISTTRSDHNTLNYISEKFQDNRMKTEKVLGFCNRVNKRTKWPPLP